MAYCWFFFGDKFVFVGGDLPPRIRYNLQFVMSVGGPDPEYAPGIIRNNRPHVGCIFWQPADFSANTDGVIQSSAE